MQITSSNKVENIAPAVRSLGLVSVPSAPALTALTERDQQAAWLDAFGMPIGVIESALGLEFGALLSLRARHDYREFIKRCLRIKASAVIERSDGDVEDLFNGQISPSVAALIEVRDDPYAKGSDRIKAATEFLNRASKAPKAKTEVEERKTIITIPVSELRNMRRALIEEGAAGDAEVAELVAGRDEDEGQFVVDAANSVGERGEN